MGEAPIGDGGFLSSTSGFLRRWGLLLVIGLAVFVISYIIWGRKNSNSSLLPGQDTQTGSNGQPTTEYVPDSGPQYINITRNDYGGSSGGTTGGSTPSNPAPPTSSTPPPAPTPAPAGAPSQPAPVVNNTNGTVTAAPGNSINSVAKATGTTPAQLYTMNSSVADHYTAQSGNAAKGSPFAATFNKPTTFHLPPKNQKPASYFRPVTLKTPNHGRVA